MVRASIGELHSDSIRDYATKAGGFAFAKIGMSDWRRRPDSVRKWFSTRLALPQGVCAVPVVYADGEATGWTDFPAAVRAAIALASASQTPLLVIDTFRKDRGNLLDLVTVAELQKLSHVAAKQSVGFVLAGSLDERAVEKLLPLAPAYFGVRGAACQGGRNETIDLGRVKSLAQLIRGTPQKIAS
jgi:uncharacterized protein (UPF0264 family)